MDYIAHGFTKSLTRLSNFHSLNGNKRKKDKLYMMKIRVTCVTNKTTKEMNRLKNGGKFLQLTYLVRNL